MRPLGLLHFCEVGFCFPFFGTEEGFIRNKEGPFFSFKKGPLKKYPTGIFFNSPPKMCLSGLGISPVATGDQGLRPLDTHPLL